MFQIKQKNPEVNLIYFTKNDTEKIGTADSNKYKGIYTIFKIGMSLFKKKPHP